MSKLRTIAHLPRKMLDLLGTFETEYYIQFHRISSNQDSTNRTDLFEEYSLSTLYCRDACRYDHQEGTKPLFDKLPSTQFDTEDMDRGPHDRKGVRTDGYLVYLQYDNNFNLVPLGSGARRVENPNQLEHLLTDEILIETDGFMHMYVSNGSMSPIFYDNFEVTVMRGKTRQINHYGSACACAPAIADGLRMSSRDGHTHDYTNMYTSKELQTGEFDPSVSTGLEMYDFHARFYDPQLGRWFAPDPAEQFSNPYLAMGNNPVMYVDPDGEFIVPMLIGAGISVLTNGISNTTNGQGFFDNAGKAALIGGIGGALSFGVGNMASGLSGIDRIIFQTMAHGNLGAGMSSVSGGSPGAGFVSGALGSLAGTGAGALAGQVNSNALKAGITTLGGAAAGGAGAAIMGGNFWDGARNGAISAGLNHFYSSSLRPKVFVDNGNSFVDSDSYMSELRDHLIANNFSTRTDVVESTSWNKFLAWAKGNPSADVTIRSRVLSGDRADPINKQLGYANAGMRHAVIYGPGNYPHMELSGTYNPSIMDLVNITTHELGHAIFGFTHFSHTNGLMNEGYRIGSPPIYFNPSQLTLIRNHYLWGGQ